MTKIFRLVYAEFGAPNLEAMTAYYKGIIGARVTADGPGGAKYLSLGLDDHNIALTPADNSGLIATGFQLAQGVQVDAFARHLKDRGLSPILKSDARPGVEQSIELDIAGFRFEFFSKMAMPAPGFGLQGVAPNKLGHIALMTPQAEMLVKFFTEVMGCYETDRFEQVATFLTCNHDHHVLNILAVPFVKMHHIAFELRGPAHQHVAMDLLARAKLPVLWGPSRHTAGHNYASYHYDPDYHLVELYADMDVYLPDLGLMEPRPWHETLPQRPKTWLLSEVNAWGWSRALGMKLCRSAQKPGCFQRLMRGARNSSSIWQGLNLLYQN